MRACSVASDSFATPWTVALEATLSMGFPRQSGLPFPSPGDLPDLGIKPVSLGSPVLAGGFFTTEPSGKPRAWAQVTRTCVSCPARCREKGLQTHVGSLARFTKARQVQAVIEGKG